jgi:cobaltochelatase CobN
VVQAIGATSSRAEWQQSDQGLGPLDAAMQVAIPEFDGRIITVPVSFKEADGEGLVRYVAEPDRCARAAGVAVRLARLRHTPPERLEQRSGRRLENERLEQRSGRRTRAAGRRVAVVLSNYPTQHSRVGNGVGLDTPASAVEILDRLTAEGYDTGDWPHLRDEPLPTESPLEPLPPGDRLIHRLIAAGGFDEAHLTEEQLAANPFALGADTYRAWFAELPEALRAAITAHWGEPPGEVLVHDSGDGAGEGGRGAAAGGRGSELSLRFAALELGNVLVAIQPPRGFGENPVAIYHDPDLPPTHHYLAFYRWLDRAWGADAVCHLGKHGTLEWLPGKSLGLSSACAPDQVLGDLPFVYPFVVNDPGEGTQAKRRSHAVIVDHLVPPMTRAETYDDLARLEQLLDEYEHVKAMDPAKDVALRGEIWQLLRSAELTRDLGWSDADRDDAPEDLDDRLVEVDGWLCEIKDVQIRGGLHVLGRAPEGEARTGLVLAILRLPQAGHPGLRQAIAHSYGLDEAALLAAPGEPAGHAPPELLAAVPGPARTQSDLVDRLEDAASALVEAMDAKGWDPQAADAVAADVLGGLDAAARAPVAGVLAFAASDVVPRLEQTAGELDALTRALAGRHTPSGPAGAPTRGRVDVLPTGKNFYSVDPKALPSELSWQVGWSLADDLIAAHTEQHGAPPRHVALVVWGTAAMRTHGDDVAEALALLGVRPVWTPESRRVTGLELMSLAELGRARVDVTLRISGFFRDAFPHLVALVDDAVALAAEASDEPDELNPVAAAARDDAAALQAEQDLDADTARRRATTRVFGAKPGAYGAGLLPLIDARNWRDDADLAEVYATWGGHAYGRGLNGVEARDDMARAFSRVQVAVKNTDSREHDLLDSDDYFQEHGGMVALVRHLSGAGPQAVIGDSSDPGRVATRDLATEVTRVYRSRVANPKWIEAMRAHGYKGAFELAATVDYLFGYDATAGCVADWMYHDLAARYTEDPDTRAFLEQSNPWALKAIAERLLEAADRGLWAEPDPETLASLRATYLATEGDLEDRT